MRFEEVIGQVAAKERLLEAHRSGRVSHAQLLSGPQGSQGLPLALAFAQYLCCARPEASDSCGQCPSCKKYQKMVHPDLHFVFPVVKTPSLKNPVSKDFLPRWREFVLDEPRHTLARWLSKLANENKQGGIFAQEAEEIIKTLNLKTYESEYKVMVVWLPELMNPSAANKLLKVLEEPPPKILFLLVSQEPEQLLQTILSRVQHTRLPKLHDASLGRALGERHQVGPGQLDYLLRVADGDYVKALEALDSARASSEDFRNFSEWMRMCYGVKVPEVMAWVEEMASIGREGQKQFLLYALRMVRESFALNLAPAHHGQLVHLAQEEMAFAQRFAPFIRGSNVAQIAAELDLAHTHIERNAANKIVLLDLSLKMMRCLKT